MNDVTFATAGAISLLLLVWLGWTGVGTREAMRTASQRAVRVAELRGTIAYLDEWLTMSANMASASGNRRWAERYDEAVPKLDAALAEVTEIATPAVRAALSSTTAEAHRDLATMERRALQLAASGELAAAQALMNGPEYLYLKDVYATGVEVFGQELKSLVDTRATDLNHRAWAEAIGLGVSAILLVASVLMMRGHARLRGAMERAEAVARTDALTGLPNRAHFYYELDSALVASPRTGPGPGRALLLIDLDRFKAVNDAYGYSAGDRLLQLVADRLRDILAPGEFLARLGGDEFAVLALADPEWLTAATNLPPSAERLVTVLTQPFALGEAVIQLGVSIGVALVGGGATVGDLMHKADVALHRAKADGRGCVRVFDPEMDQQVRSRALLAVELRQAIADDAILPHYQPLVDLHTGRLIGVEMLARWPHPTRGMVSPADFIPAAEELGLIGAMTERLLRQACRAAALWPDDLTLACNISPLQLRDTELPALVGRILAEAGLPARRLELEVTESALVGDLALARSLLDQLKALGVRLALDDFGTGYSSLRHLQSLPFDKLKIDASFVGAMAGDRESSKIVSAVVGLGHSLGMCTVAEGVETEETAALLRSLGCDIGQGWLFGRPAGVQAIEAMLGALALADAQPHALVA